MGGPQVRGQAHACAECVAALARHHRTGADAHGADKPELHAALSQLEHGEKGRLNMDRVIDRNGNLLAITKFRTADSRIGVNAYQLDNEMAWSGNQMNRHSKPHRITGLLMKSEQSNHRSYHSRPIQLLDHWIKIP